MYDHGLWKLLISLQRNDSRIFLMLGSYIGLIHVFEVVYIRRGPKNG